MIGNESSYFSKKEKAIFRYNCTQNLYIKDTTGKIKVIPNFDDNVKFKMIKTTVETSNNVDELLDFLNLSVEEKNNVKNCDLGKRVVKYVVEEYSVPLDQCFTVRSNVKEIDGDVFLELAQYKAFSRLGSKRMIVKEKKRNTLVSSIAALALVTSSFFYIGSGLVRVTAFKEGEEDEEDEDI